jgi:hypothetical protein
MSKTKNNRNKWRRRKVIQVVLLCPAVNGHLLHCRRHVADDGVLRPNIARLRGRHVAVKDRRRRSTLMCRVNGRKGALDVPLFYAI